jgi:putative transposase
MPFVSKRPALQLTEDELEQLNKASKSRTQSERTVERAKILLGYHGRKSISQIARDLGTNRPKVERTINKAFAFGIQAALEDLPRNGRSRRISSGARTWILSLACSKLLDHGHPYELWTQRLLAEHIKKHCIDNGFPKVSKIIPFCLYTKTRLMAEYNRELIQQNDSKHAERNSYLIQRGVESADEPIY